MTGVAGVALVNVFARSSISFESSVACAGKGRFNVDTSGVSVAIVGIIETLVDIGTAFFAIFLRISS